ncbi:hypothetical protein [Actinocorallia longicatena]|uniref:Uncharacterized protein n=1 Tax=Actinocorallia longicatena TaxID=111803 RepID=A0ABP6QM39_9ACTN
MLAVVGVILMVVGTVLLVGDPAGGVSLVLPGIVTVLSGAALLLFALLFAGRMGPNRLLASRRRRVVADAPVSLLEAPADAADAPESPQPRLDL